ncbi:MAG: outer membrane beta-barrel protein [Bacillota bacterium]
MKNAVIVLFLSIVFFNQSIFSQSAQTGTEGVSDSSRALQFQIGSNFTLSSFQGATISSKHHFTKEKALRLGLSIATGSSDQDQTADRSLGDSLVNISTGKTTNTSYSIQLSAQYVYYFNPKDKVLIYTGAGPSIGYDYMKRSSDLDGKSPGSYPVQSVSRGEEKTTSWSPGISGVVGVEWFAAKNISFLAEYGLVCRYFWSNYELKNFSQTVYPTSQPYMENNSKTESSGWSIANSGVKFGLTVYFQ